MQNYLRPLDPGSGNKNQNFTNKGSREKPLQNFTFNLDVPKSIPLSEDEEQRIWKSYTPKIFHSMTWTTILAHQSVDFRRKEC